MATGQGVRLTADQTVETDVPASIYWCGEVRQADSQDIAVPTRAATEPVFTHARLLIRAAAIPLGFVIVPVHDGVVRRADIDAAVHHANVGTARDRGYEVQPVAAGSPRTVTAVVCTRQRPAELSRCLTALAQIPLASCEVLIVDNAPSDDATERAFHQIVGDDPRFRYVVEPRPGLSAARNRALRDARGEIVAFTDDDVRVDAHWLEMVLAGFERHPQVGCVTGLVASASLLTRAEQFFDARVWWSSTCTRRLFWASRGPLDPIIHPFSAGMFGTGANMAFRRDLMLELGGFDEALGTGSATGGGEDLDAFVRVLRSGYALSYEPAALVWHEHRASDDALQKQMYAYGKGLGAYITKYLTQRDTVLPVLSRAPRAVWHLLVLGRRSGSAAKTSTLPRGVQRAEMWGLFAGPLAYFRARRRAPTPPARTSIANRP